ncbi:MAG: hypothetical protein SOI44_07625 [Lactimicrobium sp.]|jgi:uncharacterized ubiquitin-like protein YukD|uniref:hypothetical protein n=1 Tax=Lactimicrobium sp. TaxID=2563780 RepID=UPI002F352B63
MSNAMEKAIERFCHERDNGLLLLDAPTGSGKTYNVLNFIYDHYDDKEYRNKKFFFLTTLKKNLPVNDLKSLFVKNDRLMDFQRDVIMLDNNADALLNSLRKKENTIKVPSSIQQWPEYQNVISRADFINNYRSQSCSHDLFEKSLFDNALKQFSNTDEPKFRHKIEELLKSRWKSPKQRLQLIENNESYQWIAELYPAVKTIEKRVFFMSIDKFFLGNSTLIEPTYTFYNHPIIKDSIIFIDEVDSTKSHLLNQIISKGIESKIDYLALFDQLHSVIKTKGLPSELTAESKASRKYRDDSEKYKSPSDIVKEIERVLDETYAQYNMQYSFRLEPDSQSNGRNFLFNDLKYHSVFQGKNSFIEINTDKNSKQNWLRLCSKKMSTNEKSVIGMLSSVKGSLSYFVNGCGYLGMNYKNYMDEKNKSGDDDFSFDEAVQSILSEFVPAKDFKNYLREQVLSGEITNRRKKQNTHRIPMEQLDQSVYAKGFRYYDFLDEPTHQMHSEIRLYDFNETPEHVMKQICESAHVIGISATATLPTVLSNYDLDWLKTVLGSNYYKLPEEDLQNIRTEFENSNIGYHNVNIHVNPINVNEDFKQTCIDLLEDEEEGEEFCNELDRTIDKSHDKKALLKILTAVKMFMKNDSLHSCLCFSNKLAKDSGGKLDRQLIIKAARIMNHHLNKQYDVEKMFVIMSSENFRENQKLLCEDLSKGEKRFVLTSYSTLGAGQNLQYDAPKRQKLIAVNDHTWDNHKRDFDSIYLEKPTNQVVNIYSELSDENLIRLIYQIEFLMESGDISQAAGIALIKEGFRHLQRDDGAILPSSKSEGIRTLGNDLYDNNSYNNSILQVLIQAVGRICRTGHKNPDIQIMIDEECFQKCDFRIMKTRLMNPEFRAIVNESLKYQQHSESKEYIKLKNQADILSDQSMQAIQSILKSTWDKISIEQWRTLRMILLKYPTVSLEIIEQHPEWKNIYFKLPVKANRYSYRQENDYHQNDVSFDMDLPQKVSQEDIHLQDVLTIPGLREYFEKNQFAVEFKKNDYIMTPPEFNNIYKGALGEEIGKFILETYLHIKVMPIDDPAHFELFDSVLDNGIYLDFKYWKDTMRVDAKEQKEKIMQKLDKCHGRRAVIINILGYEGSQITPSDDGRIIEIPYLFDLNKKELSSKMLSEIMNGGYLK